MQRMQLVVQQQGVWAHMTGAGELAALLQMGAVAAALVVVVVVMLQTLVQTQQL
jgi:hypothetical protein